MRSVHMKLVMILVLLILSLMTVVGAFLINSVTAFYLEEFYTQMADVFGSQELYDDLTTQTPGEEGGKTGGAEQMAEVLKAYSGALGVDNINRKLYILDSNGNCLIHPDGETGPREYTKNLSFALTTGLETNQSGDESNPALNYMDVAVPIHRGGRVLYHLHL